jgi:hypothetical protein
MPPGPDHRAYVPFCAAGLLIGPAAATASFGMVDDGPKRLVVPLDSGNVLGARVSTHELNGMEVSLPDDGGTVGAITVAADLRLIEPDHVLALGLTACHRVDQAVGLAKDRFDDAERLAWPRPIPVRVEAQLDSPSRP